MTDTLMKGPMSLAELTFYVTRAVVGAGAPFGIGEDVARAVVRAAADGSDLTALLIRALIALADGDATGQARLQTGPQPDTRTISGAEDQPLSALFAAPIINDWIRAQGAEDSYQTEFEGDSLTVTAAGQRLIVGPIDVVELARSGVAQMVRSSTPVPPDGGIYVDATCWPIVEQYFNRCLVPSSEASRLAGAGAGLVETD